MDAKTDFTNSLRLACDWLVDIARVNETGSIQDAKYPLYKDWKGAIRGEYSAAEKTWGYFGPVWHTGQAVKALVMASGLLGEKYLEAARGSAEFILQQQVLEGPDRGIILAYEDSPDRVNTSAILECLDGLFHLSEALGTSRYSDAAVLALEWLAANAWIKGEGLIKDTYELPTRTFHQDRPDAYTGRPLLEDCVFAKGYKVSGRKELLDVAVEVGNRLLRDENPDGNWIHYGPCDESKGLLHPRHAFWWGKPMFDLHQATGRQEYLDCFDRSVQWYKKAMRRDGGLFRATYTDFNTDSFGHATSAVGCAAVMFVLHYQHFHDEGDLLFLSRALTYCKKLQFTRPDDPNLTGAILEKVLPPDGTDRSPYHLRDLGTIFYIQALSLAMASDVPLRVEVDNRTRLGY